MTVIVNLDALDVPTWKRLAMIETARRLRRIETPTERRLWSAVRGRKLAGVKFRRQQPIGPFVVDFFAAEQRLIVEIDGGVHETQVEQDAERQRLIEGAGYRFVRVSTGDVTTDLDAVLRRIAIALSEE